MIPHLPTQEQPEWLRGERLEEQFRVQPLLAGSVFYPACGYDGDPIKHLAGNYYSFVYVDKHAQRDETERAISGTVEDGNRPGFRGYRVIHSRDVSHELRLFPPDFGLWCILERRHEFGEEHGPARFSLLYIRQDGIQAFRELYREYEVFPAVVAIIQPGGITGFAEEDGPLNQAIEGNPAGRPSYLLHGGYGRPESYEHPCWSQYGEVVTDLAARVRNEVNPRFLRLFRRSN